MNDFEQVYLMAVSFHLLDTIKMTQRLPFLAFYSYYKPVIELFDWGTFFSRKGVAEGTFSIEMVWKREISIQPLV